MLDWVDWPLVIIAIMSVWSILTVNFVTRSLHQVIKDHEAFAKKLAIIINNQVIIDKNVKREAEVTRSGIHGLRSTDAYQPDYWRHLQDINWHLERIADLVGNQQVRLAQIHPPEPRRDVSNIAAAQTPIAEMGFSRRIAHRFQSWNAQHVVVNNPDLPLIRTFGDLLQWSEEDLMQIPQFGRQCLAEVKNKLAQLGLDLYSSYDTLAEANMADEAAEQEALLNQRIEELDFSVRTYNCLKGCEILTVEELVRQSEAELMQIRRFGRKSLLEVKDKLAQIGLTLR